MNSALLVKLLWATLILLRILSKQKDKVKALVEPASEKNRSWLTC